MPESSIDISSPVGGSTQPLEFTANIEYDNQSTAAAWIRVQCSFATGGGSHTVISDTAVAAGSKGSFDANFPHTSGATDVTVTARLTQFSDGLGDLYASTVNGDITIAAEDKRDIKIDRGFGAGFRFFVDEEGVAGKSDLRVVRPVGKALELKGTYDATKGTALGVVVLGSKKKRPQIIYESADGQTKLDNTTVPPSWTATIPAKVLDGKKPRAAVVILYDGNRVYVASDSVGVRES